MREILFTYASTNYVLQTFDNFDNKHIQTVGHALTATIFHTVTAKAAFEKGGEHKKYLHWKEEKTTTATTEEKEEEEDNK